ncbi:MAG: hypothetical protein WCL30_04350 [Pseudomonadota bacterium]
MKNIAAIFMIVLLTSCQAISNFADGIGKHMPVIGERCEHWQCVTESGRRASEANKNGTSAPAIIPPPTSDTTTPSDPTAYKSPSSDYETDPTVDK